MKRLLCVSVSLLGLMAPASAQTPAQLQTSINGINWNQSTGQVSTTQVEGLFNQIVALFNGGIGIAFGSVAANGSTALSALETADTGWSAYFPNPVGVFATQGNQNAIVGYELNNLSASTNALPSAVIGFGKVTTSGNIVFGDYGLAEVWGATGVAVGAEITARNESGVAADTNLPPNEAVGTTTVVPNALQVTCGGLNGCSLGVLISPEGGSSNAFNTAEYISGAGYSTYGMFIDAANAGTQTAEVLKSNGNGLALHILEIGTPAPTNTVMDIVNNSAVTEFSIKQSGDIFSAGALTATAANLSANSALTLSQNAVTSFSVINTNAGGSSQANFVAQSAAGTVTLEATNGGFADLLSTINATFFIDARGSGAAFNFRTGASPTSALTLSASQAAVFSGTVALGGGSAITSSGPGGALGNPAFVASSVSKTCGATIVVTNGVVTSC